MKSELREKIQRELLLSKATHTFTFTRDELIDLFGLPAPWEAVAGTRFDGRPRPAKGSALDRLLIVADTMPADTDSEKYRKDLLLAAIDQLNATAPPQVADGFVLVPVKPTKEMIRAGQKAAGTEDLRWNDLDAESVWEDMLKAAHAARG